MEITLHVLTALGAFHVNVPQDTLADLPDVLISTNAIETHVTQMLSARILLAHSPVLVTLDIMEQDLFAQTSMNVSTAPVILTVNVKTYLDHSGAPARLDLVEMVSSVEI